MRSSLPCDGVSDWRLRLIADSYQRLTGKPLIDLLPTPCRAWEGVETPGVLDATPKLTLPLQGGGSGGDAALRRALWEAPFAIVAHGTEDDPVFFYGNRLALRLFGMSFDEFIRLPSRLSAEPLAQEARIKLLEKVAQQGYVAGYSAMRIAKSGRRFMIDNATVWNLLDERGAYHGQAAVFVERAI